MPSFDMNHDRYKQTDLALAKKTVYQTVGKKNGISEKVLENHSAL